MTQSSIVSLTGGLTRAEIRAIIDEHREVRYRAVHIGCACGRFGPDTPTDGHQWWLDHMTNQLHQKDNQ